MKFQKGLLNADEPEPKKETAQASVVPDVAPTSADKPIVLREVEKNRLFQTVKEETGSERSYLKLLGIVAVFAAIAVGVALYFMQPGVGDRIKVSRETELAVRDHFQTKEKRSATDITFYQCDQYQWAHVNVEKRTDIKTNPVYAIDKYAARITQTSDGSFNITAAPITSDDMDVPCK